MGRVGCYVNNILRVLVTDRDSCGCSWLILTNVLDTDLDFVIQTTKQQWGAEWNVEEFIF